MLGVCYVQETYHFAEAEGLCENGLRRSAVFLVSKKVAVTSLMIGCTVHRLGSGRSDLNLAFTCF